MPIMVNKRGNRQTHRTNKAIQDAYLELLSNSSPKKIKITEICQRANISRPTFYNHYQTKDEVLLAYLDEILDEMFIEFRKLQLENEKDALANFETASTQFFSLWRRKDNLYKLIKDAQAECLLIDKLKDHHLKTYHIIGENNFPISDPEILEYFISHISYVFFSVLDQWMENGLKRTPAEMGKLLTELYEPLGIRKLSEKYS